MAALPKNPKTILSPTEVQHVLIEEPVFLRAQQLVSVPWQAMAAIWYRESFSVSPPKTPGGPFQFDPPDPARSTLKALLKRYVTALSDSDLQTLVTAGIDDFAAACIFAACHLRDGAKYVLSQDHSDTAMLDAFYGYNGRAWGLDPENSPYVMNNYDAAHMNMRIRGSVPDGNGGRKWIDTVDLRPGAFTVYKQLCALGTRSDTCHQIFGWTTP
jgi:hypothetical protein